MSKLVYRITPLLSAVVESVPIGTNLGLFHLLWMLLSGLLLLSRGAVIPGLAAWGLAEERVLYVGIGNASPNKPNTERASPSVARSGK